jgi:predicted PurR-regulated permease PerM
MPGAPGGAAASIPQQVARYALIVALIALGAWVLHRFLPALCWAVVLAIATSSVYDRWRARFSGQRRHLWAALTFTVLMGVVLIVPLIYGAFAAAREAISLVRLYADSDGPPLPDWLVQHLPWLADWLREIWDRGPGHSGATAGALIHSDSRVFEWTRLLGLQVLRRAETLAFTLLTLFFVYLNRDELTESVRRVTRRMFGPSVEPLLEHVAAAIRATVDGVVLVAVAEGAIMGGVYAAAGAPHPVLFGALTGVFAMVPFAAPVAFGAVALILAGQSAIAAAITVAAIGTLVLFVADHFVRPFIIGGGARLPFLWVLLGILGGIESFGLVGIFLGPALMAALCALWRNWSAQESPPH